MSRIGKKTIELPQGVNVEVKDKEIIVSGPKGKLVRKLNDKVKINIENNIVTVLVVNETEKSERSLWGTFASHIINMVKGVTEGFKRQLEVNGVGYKVAMQGTDVKLDVGFSHPVIFKIPEGIIASIEKNQIKLEGIDKELLGNTAASIRKVRKPEPYKGKGIKYVEEVIRRKEGKTAAKA